MKINIITLIAWMTCGFAISAQTYHSSIDIADSTGFHLIQLPTEGIARMANDYRDVRIIGQSGREIPYLIHDDSSLAASSAYTEFPITSHQLLKDSATILILQNSERLRINNLCITIGNAGVTKQIRLTGSNDQKTWYSVRENAMFSSVNHPNDVAEIKLIDFPLIDYPFFRIEIDDRNSSPVNVIKAGIYNTTHAAVPVSYTQVNTTHSIRDSVAQKTTWADVTFGQPMAVDKIEVTVDAPPFFLRNVDVYAIEKDTANGIRRQFVMNATFRSDEPIVLYPGTIRARGITFAIGNRDNPPLVIRNIKVFQKNRFCLAWMEKNDSCHLTFGTPSLAMPDYDIQFFKDKAAGTLAVLKTSSPTLVPAKIQPPVPEPFFRDTRFIWAAIIVVIGVLGYFTYVMMKENNH